MVQIVKAEEAVGLPLAYDITEIRPGEFKGTAFRQGHIIQEKDISYLHRLGKEHLFVLKMGSDQVAEQAAYDRVHENDAAVSLANALCGEGVEWTGPPREGKIHLMAMRDGLLKVDVKGMIRFNEMGEIMCATRHTNSLISKGTEVGFMHVVPLFVSRSTVEKGERIAKNGIGILRVLPIRKSIVGVMITGNEVYYGRIEDRFEALIRKKVEAYGGDILDVVILPDDDERIAAAALDLIDRGADTLIATGGMSVDPDDRTRSGLLKAGTSEVLPGAMFMIGDLGGIPVFGIPSGGLKGKTSIFDIVYPRIMAGDRLSRNDIAGMGHGGLCLKCETCRFPDCPFGKGS